MNQVRCPGWFWPWLVKVLARVCRGWCWQMDLVYAFTGHRLPSKDDPVLSRPATSFLEDSQAHAGDDADASLLISPGS